MKLREMTNEELASVLAEIPCKSWHDLDREAVHDMCREAAARLRRIDTFASVNERQDMDNIEFRRLLKVAENALNEVVSFFEEIHLLPSVEFESVLAQACVALAAIRERS